MIRVDTPSPALMLSHSDHEPGKASYLDFLLWYHSTVKGRYPYPLDFFS